jgi:hypothetical protein
MRPGPLLLHIKQPPNLYTDRPVVLEDDESDTPEPAPEAAAVSVSVDAGIDPASELSKGRCAMSTTTSAQFLCSSIKVWLRRWPSLTLIAIPLGPHRTRSTNVITEWEAHRTS